jgi:hypothetical protein
MQIVFSQIPDLDKVWWLSTVAAIMSFSYSTIGILLGVVQIVGTLFDRWIRARPNNKRQDYIY